MGNITIQGDLTGGVPGGEVGGASNLTTVGAIPYVSSAGVLNQDATKLFWDATNKRLGVGTASPSSTLTIAGITGVTSGGVTPPSGIAGLWLSYTGNTSTIQSVASGFSGKALVISGYPLSFQDSQSGAESARFAITSQNLLIGTTTDLGYGLHAANKGTNGNLLVFDPTATTGTTKAVFKEGAGQSTTASTEWQDSAGTFTARVQAGGGFQSKVAYSVIDSGATVNHIGLYTTGLSIASGKLIAFSATTEATATKDLSLSRASAGVLQVGDGGANANGYLTAARIGVGTGSPANIIDAQSGGTAIISTRSTSAATNALFESRGGSSRWYAGITASHDAKYSIVDVNTSVYALQVHGTTDNITIGGTTDGNYKLDVQKSGSTGTLRVYDQTATTGSTRVRVRGGAADGTGDVIFTVVESSDNVNNNSVQVSPNAVQVTTGAAFSYWNSGALLFPSGSSIAFTSSATSAFGTKDISLSRASAGVLQVGDGGANSNGTLKAAALQAVVANTGYPELVTMTNSSATNGSWKLQVPGSAAGSRNGSLEILDYNGSPRYTISVSGDQTWILPAGVQAASLSSTGTYTLYNQTSTTGVTKAVIRAGAGQSTTNLTEWQNNAGTVIASVDSIGSFLGTNLTLTTGGSFRFAGRGYLYAPSDGVLRLTNDTFTDFSRLQFGGTTSSFPALKRNGAALSAVLADDSQYADFYSRINIQQALIVSSLPAAAAGNAGATAYITDATATTIGSIVAGGGSNKVMVWSNGTNWKIFAN